MATHKDVAILLSSLSLGLSAGLALCLVVTSAHHCPDPHPQTITVTAPTADPGSCDTPENPVVLQTYDTLPAQLSALVPANAGHAVSVGDEVLARWTDGSWWEATVTAIDGPTVTAAWRDGSTPTALPADGIAPLSERPGMAHGDLALCKWQDSTRWWRAVIIEQQDSLHVQYIDGTVEPFFRQCTPAARR